MVAAMTITAAACGSCGSSGSRGTAGASSPRPNVTTVIERPAVYRVSPQGGTPATGPGERYNRCERIWCLVHGENFFIDHFLKDHTGWIIHDDLAGDIFVAKGRIDGPEFPHASTSALRLCGAHVHPFVLGKGGGPVRDGYFSYSLGYDRAHFRAYGTRLEPCCINGLGSDYLHSKNGRRARFSDLSEYRAHPEMGWQKPYAGPAPDGG